MTFTAPLPLLFHVHGARQRLIRTVVACRKLKAILKAQARECPRNETLNDPVRANTFDEALHWLAKIRIAGIQHPWLQACCSIASRALSAFMRASSVISYNCSYSTLCTVRLFSEG